MGIGGPEINIVIRAVDEFSKTMGKVSQKLKDNRAGFMVLTGAGAAMTGMFGGIAIAGVKAAADNEGAWNKFNTVFRGIEEEMGAWVKDIRKIMPTAETEIVRMAAGMQDLLVPMGFARDEAAGMSREMIELANKVAAFNDVNPQQVLEAMQSGLMGMPRPLRQFGINTDDARLQQIALDEVLGGSVEKWSDLDSESQKAAKAQALIIAMYRDSADAIAGFDKNQDSAIRRMQEIKASIADLTNTIGDALLPIFDELLKAIIPIISKVADWIKENPKLTKIIILAGIAIGGLLLAIGTLGLILPTIIVGIKLLLGPIGLVIAVIIGLGAIISYIVAKWDEIMAHPFVKSLWEFLKHAIFYGFNYYKGIIA